MVIWIIGLSGSGKTTIGKKVYDLWKQKSVNTVLIDGDEIRQIFKHEKNEDAYSIQGRAINSERIVELCAWLDRQNINVVCCILSIFEEARQKNRQKFSKYFETYVSVPFDKLVKRDIKNIYKPALHGNSKNVVGVDIPFEQPKTSDLIIDNSEDGNDFIRIAEEILRKAKVF